MSYKEKWQRFSDWKGWKWVYWGGMMLGLYLFICSFWNITLEILSNNHLINRNKIDFLFVRKPFMPFFSSKSITEYSLILVLISSLPFFISFFSKKSYFTKILLAITLSFIFLMVVILSYYLIFLAYAK